MQKKKTPVIKAMAATKKIKWSISLRRGVSPEVASLAKPAI
jgi:hypothetical protein